METSGIEETIRRITAQIETADGDSVRGELLFRRGRMRWKIQDRSGAMNDYAEAAELVPGCGAEAALAQAREIMDFRNTDLYNP